MLWHACLHRRETWRNALASLLTAVTDQELHNMLRYLVRQIFDASSLWHLQAKTAEEYLCVTRRV